MNWAPSTYVGLRGATRQPLSLLLEPSPRSGGCHGAGAGGQDTGLRSRGEHGWALGDGGNITAGDTLVKAIPMCQILL